MRILHLSLLPALIPLAMPCSAQTGTVTFYSIQPTARQQIADTLTPFGTVAFTGLIYDGNQLMAHARRGRFVSFHVPVGEHQFSASYRRLDHGDPAVHFNVEDGGYYCVRLSASYRSGSPFIPIGVVHSIIEQVPCAEAFREAGSYKRLDAKRIEGTARAELVASPTFPSHD